MGKRPIKQFAADSMDEVQTCLYDDMNPETHKGRWLIHYARLIDSLTPDKDYELFSPYDSPEV